jgi:hypothetical protein
MPHHSSAEEALGLHAFAVSFTATVMARTEDTPGVKVGGEARQWQVQTGTQRFDARLAFSCLVEPEPGDQVACWRDADSEPGVYITALLHRAPGGAPQRLRLAPQSELHGGQLHVHLEAAQLQAESLSVWARSMHSMGELCKATWGQLRLAGSHLSTVFDQQVHHAGMHQRTVAGLDRVQAQVLEQRADELMHLHAPTVLTEGDRLVKTRGAQIHFG